jgi:uncharacterized protein
MMTTTAVSVVLPVVEAEPAFAALRGQSFMRLTTYRKSGEPVATPVWFAEEGEKLYVTTDRISGKVKRLRHATRV